MFDRFGLFVHEGGGTASRVYLDDLEYSTAEQQVADSATVYASGLNSMTTSSLPKNCPAGREQAGNNVNKPGLAGLPVRARRVV